jgi:signal transduction histidine kinase
MATIAARAAEGSRGVARSRAFGSLAAAGILAVAVAVWSGRGDPDALSLARGLVVASYVTVGIYTWWQRPGSRFGLLLAGIGLLYSIASLSASDDALLHTIGRVALAFVVVFIAFVLLCFPHDRLATRLERRLVGGFALATALLWVVALPLVEKAPAAGPLTDCGSSCPENAFRLVTTSDAVSSGIALLVNAVTAVAVVGVAAAIARKARSPSLLQRRMVAPVFYASVALALSYALYSLLRQAGAGDTDALQLVGAASALAIPAAILVGQVRGRVFAAAKLARLVTAAESGPPTPQRIESLLRDALGDPALRLALALPGGNGYVDVWGRAVELPKNRSDVEVTAVMRNGRPVAALIHDPALEDASGIAEGLAGTALMVLENAQLVKELQASRARIVATAQRERLRLERDLHDSAQQRLFAIQVKLAAMRSRSLDSQLIEALDELVDDVAAVAEECRDLAHGLYPPALREFGLTEALRSAVRAAAVPVRFAGGVGRCSQIVEEAVYFCALEALQNATKHAGPDVHVAVTLERRGTDLVFAVTDDGTGFDATAPSDGIGMVSMSDRVGAVGGELEIASAPGLGTTVRGVVRRCWDPSSPAPAADSRR